MKKLKNTNFSDNAKKKLFDAASDTDKTDPSLIYLCEKNIFFAAVSLAARNFPAGQHEVKWNATTFASGIYLYQLWVSTPMEQVDKFTETKKLLLIK